jgi:hypothetical protein
MYCFNRKHTIMSYPYLYNVVFRSPSSGYPRPGGGAGAGPAMWQWQNNNGSADPALTPTTTEGVDMLSMLGRKHTESYMFSLLAADCH